MTFQEVRNFRCLAEFEREEISHYWTLMSQLVSQPLNQSLSSSTHSLLQVINLISLIVRCLDEFEREEITE